MKTIKINFVDEFVGFDPKEEYIYKLLSREYKLDISDNPDYVFCACFGHNHLDYDCVKILVTGENQIPDFNLYDYAIGFDPISFSDRYLRMPLFPFYEAYERANDRTRLFNEQDPLNRKFCSFVVSNGSGDPLRTEFFKRLSQYKKVDSGGRYLNNIGGNGVADKVSFCAQYKFNIAFENSSAPGYTTEKVMEPLIVNSIPIYYGNPDIREDINPDSLVIVRSRDDFDRAIEEIRWLDSNDEAYIKKLQQNPFVHDKEYYDDRMLAFLRNIIEQPLNSAKRVIPYGYQSFYREELRNAYRATVSDTTFRQILKHCLKKCKIV